ncbi:hypothetical protein PKF05_08355 [Fusobacterium simiae]|uniref:Lipoprotein n=1 Tax=Fusobacterium simiae TaxID=855 RepID=A0ABT4DIV7_FUSSI|nr:MULTISPECIES: hypothetical protein [Fusobacterium]MCY7008532.1 hypothetical protein [Fusobacterium simiae]MDC7955834.1 hypothetical protein [Fusobacterium simiae]
MKKIIKVFLLILLGLVFVNCGKESDVGEFIDKEKILSEYKIENEDKTSIEFSDKNENSPIFRIFTIQKILKIDYNNPNRLDKIEEYYLNHNWKTIYKDEKTLIVSYEESDTQDYEYNIETIDNSKTELHITVSVGATRKVLENELFDMLKEAKSFIKK